MPRRAASVLRAVPGQAASRIRAVSCGAIPRAASLQPMIENEPSRFSSKSDEAVPYTIVGTVQLQKRSLKVLRALTAARERTPVSEGAQKRLAARRKPDANWRRALRSGGRYRRGAGQMTRTWRCGHGGTRWGDMRASSVGARSTGQGDRTHRGMFGGKGGKPPRPATE